MSRLTSPSTLRYSVCLSLLLCLTLLKAHAQTFDSSDNSDSYVITTGDDGRAEYALRLTLPKADITGLLIVKQTDEGELRGVMMNEFGVSAFQFSISANRKKVKLANVSALFDKWYIRRIIRNDLKILFQAHQSDIGRMRKRRQVLTPDAQTIVLLNHRAHIKYEINNHETKR